jgi:hypothetical protein
MALGLAMSLVGAGVEAETNWAHAKSPQKREAAQKGDAFMVNQVAPAREFKQGNFDIRNPIEDSGKEQRIFHQHLSPIRCCDKMRQRDLHSGASR